MKGIHAIPAACPLGCQPPWPDTSNKCGQRKWVDAGSKFVNLHLAESSFVLAQNKEIIWNNTRKKQSTQDIRSLLWHICFPDWSSPQDRSLDDPIYTLLRLQILQFQSLQRSKCSSHVLLCKRSAERLFYPVKAHSKATCISGVVASAKNLAQANYWPKLYSHAFSLVEKLSCKSGELLNTKALHKNRIDGSSWLSSLKCAVK